ncbi:LamG-like jellyroll fold domain-containing protein [Paenarthrobacter sp. NPDC058040]|uniref:LamG-like jellyroll fold domain-containing protein n=1 Tax=unclassified Paenarthrobacter TaxID=2634190 RepID=UPI0036DD1131
MASSAAFLRRACAPALALTLLLAGLSAPAVLAAPSNQPIETPPTAEPSPESSTPPEPGSERAAQSEAKASGEKVVVDDATTPTDLTVANPDGTFTRTMNTAPVRMETSEGWVDISTDLVRTVEDGKTVIKPEQIPVDLTLGAGGSSDMATIDDKEGHSIAQSWPFGTLPEPVIDANVATYRQVLPGVDLVQIAHQTGVSQVLKIESAEAAKDPRVVQMRLFLDAGNTTVSETSEGTLTATGSDTGQVELHMSGGQWWDSSQPGASALDPGTPGLTRPFSFSLGQEAGKQTQVFGMDEILQTPDLQYPIYVDPPWNTPRTSYVFVDTAYPNTSYWNGQFTDQTMNVGYLPNYWAPDGVTHLARSYFQFEGKTFDATANLINARFEILETWSSSCTPTGIASWITGEVGTGTTWNNQPQLKVRTDRGNVAKGYSSACPAGMVGFDLLAAENILLNSSKWTIMLAADNELDTSGLAWKRFANSGAIRVDYNRNPIGPAIHSIQSGRWTGAPWGATSKYVTRIPKPKLTAMVGDDEDGGEIKVVYSVRRASGGGSIFSGVVENASPKWHAETMEWGSAPALVEGDYVFEARTYDDWGGISPLMNFAFSIDLTPPVAPKITPVAGAKYAYTPDADGVVRKYTDNNNAPGDASYPFLISNGYTTDRQLRADGFIYSVSRDAPALPLADVDVTCQSPPKREFIIVCPGADSVVVNIGAVNKTTYLTVWAFDAAGNVADIGEDYQRGDAMKVTLTVPEPVLTKGVVDLVPSGNAKWTGIFADGNLKEQRVPEGSCGDVAPTKPSNARALQFNPGAGKAETAAGAVDTSGDFSIAAWVCPTSVGGGNIRSLITQLAGTTPGAALEIGETGKIRLQAWTGGQTSHIVEHVGTLPVDKWSYVTAVYDKINRQLRLSAQVSGSISNWVIAASQQNILAATPTQKVVVGQSIGGVQQFNGKIYRPIMTAEILTDEQFSTVQKAFANADGITEKEGLLR